MKIFILMICAILLTSCNEMDFDGYKDKSLDNCDVVSVSANSQIKVLYCYDESSTLDFNTLDEYFKYSVHDFKNNVDVVYQRNFPK